MTSKISAYRLSLHKYGHRSRSKLESICLMISIVRKQISTIFSLHRHLVNIGSYISVCCLLAMRPGSTKFLFQVSLNGARTKLCLPYSLVGYLILFIYEWKASSNTHPHPHLSTRTSSKTSAVCTLVAAAH